MPGRNHRESVGKQIWQIGAWIALALLLVGTIRFLTKLYMVQEILLVLLLVAVSTVTILAFAVALILFHEGIRRAALWAKAGVIRHASLNPATKQGG
jgi:membrane protein YdbS with pleckstrin-like domain